MNNAKKIALLSLRMIVLLFLVSILSFILITNAPIDPLLSYIGTESTLTQDAIDQIISRWGLNEPMHIRYLSWLKNVLSGDLGTSIAYKKPVSEIIFQRFSYSIVLMLAAWILSGIIGYFLGLFSGIKPNSIFDKITSLFCIVLQSSPSFWMGIMMLSIFAVKLGWFPIGMAIPLGKLTSETTILDKIYHLMLPAITLTITNIGKITIFTKQKVNEVMASDYILFAKARGENTTQIIKRHLMRNTAIPAITLQFSSFSELFGGMALAETVFAYPGIGSAATTAALNGDVPLLLGITMISALFVFFGNFISNIIYGIIDPRLKQGGLYA